MHAMAPVFTDTPRREKPRNTGGPTNEGEEICHIVTEREPDLALCGKDVSNYPWNPPWPMCVVCVDLAESRGMI
jgi:hypothetical protein